MTYRINLTTYFEGILDINSICKYQHINRSSRIFNYSLPYIVYINVNSTDYVDEDHVIDFEKNSQFYWTKYKCGVVAHISFIEST